MQEDTTVCENSLYVDRNSIYIYAKYANAMVRLASVVHLDDISTAYKTLKLEEGGEVGV